MAASMKATCFHKFAKYLSISLSKGRFISSTNCLNSDNITNDQNNAKEATAGLEKAFKAFEKVLTPESDIDTQPKQRGKVAQESFAAMLRKSKLVHLGDPNGRVVVGEVIECIEDDLYIDFGGKFHCVCKCPQARSNEYQRGTSVRLRLRDLELSSRFLGATRDLTLLEADATLLGLHRPNR